MARPCCEHLSRWYLCWAFGLLMACDSKLVIGSWACPAPTALGGSASAGSAGASNSAGSGAFIPEFPLPWGTGFEDDFCDYLRVNGQCYDNPGESAWHELVGSPVRFGRRAAAFSVKAGRDTHTRCFLEGKLPEEAYYGAWYFVPTVHKVNDIWNLIHFQVRRRSHRSPQTFETLWDVLLENDDAGGLRLALKGRPVVEGEYWQVPWEIQKIPGIPIGEWFHIELYLKLTSDITGEISLYQNGTRLIHAAGIRTDFEDSMLGQWYVGNLAYSLDPPQSTVYVDEVTVARTR
jgi:hypothetical protein